MKANGIRFAIIATMIMAIVSGVFGGIPEASAQWPEVVSLPRCQWEGQIVRADLSTGTTNGVKNPLGSGDPKWYLTMVANYSGSPYKWVAYSVAKNPFSWIANPLTGANWIERSKFFGPGYTPYQGAAAGTYQYRVLFNVNLALYSSVVITGRFAVDNENAIVMVNGDWITMDGDFVSWTTLPAIPTVSAPFANGVNSLEFETFNLNGPEGLIVDAKIQAVCKKDYNPN